MTIAIRDAATVVLLTDTDDGMAVWLQQRGLGLVFAAGMFAFPGGAVDDGDRQDVVVDATAQSDALVWQCPPADAAAFRRAAVRETHEESSVTLQTQDLVPWSRWITPIGPPRRFDTRFFAAALPSGQSPQAQTSEVHGARLRLVVDAVRLHHGGELAMWPPTITTLEQLQEFGTVREVMAAAPSKITAVTQ